MNSIRFKFVRGEEVKFISHLDLMKVFERALRRSKIPIAYSQGFNPHPHMVFGLPLSVGVTSEAEYADFEMSSDYDADKFITVLNSQLPKGLRVVEAKIKNTKTNIMASIAASSYDIFFSDETCDPDEMNRYLNEFTARTSIITKKEGKSGLRDVDIRPMIRKIVYKGTGSENNSYISALLSAGSSANLKPELMLAAFRETAGLKIRSLRIHRNGLFVEIDGELVNPLDDRALAR